VPQPQRHGGQPAEVLRKVQAGVIEVALEIETEAAGLAVLLRRYHAVSIQLFTEANEGMGAVAVAVAPGRETVTEW